MWCVHASLLNPVRLLDRSALSVLVDVAIKQAFGAVGWALTPVEVHSCAAVAQGASDTTAVWEAVLKVGWRYVSSPRALCKPPPASTVGVESVWGART